MGRKSQGKAGGPKSGMKPRKANRNRGRDDGNMGLKPEDFEDEVDEYHKQRDVLSLDPEDGKGSGESEEEDVYGIKEMDDSSDEDEDEEIARLKQQEKLMRKRLAMQKGGAHEEDDEDEEEGEGKHKLAAWGRKKDAYYNADNVDYELTDDEEGLKEEEEATREVRQGMVSKLTNEDYEQDDDDEDEEEDESEEDDSDDGEDEEEVAMGKVLLRKEQETKDAKAAKDAKGGKVLKKGKEAGKDDDEDEEEEEEGGGKEKAKKTASKAKKGTGDGKKGKEDGKKDTGKKGAQLRGGVQVETVRRELEQLTAEEKMAAVISDAPELLALLGEMRSGLEEVQGIVAPVLARVTSGGLATADGVSYLEAKHLLLLSYVTNIVFYLMLKAEGRSVRDHPVVARLVQIRAYLEKVRPIDKKLQYQIEKLLKAATGSLGGAGPGAGAAIPAGEEGADAGGDASALRHKPNPSALVSKLPSAEGENGVAGDGIYRPPMMAPAAMDEDVDRDGRSRADKRAEREARRRLGRSTLVKELAREVTGAPEEIREVWGAAGTRELREKKRLEARAAEEESMFTRVNLSKEERKRLKALKRYSGLGSALDDFNDDVAGFVDAIEKEGGQDGRGLAPGDALGLKKSRLIDSLAGTSLPVPAGRAAASGDMDVPLRADLSERRRQHQVRMERTLGAAGRKGGDDDDDDDDSMNPHFGGGGGRKRRVREEEGDGDGDEDGGGGDAEAAATYMAAKAAQLAKRRLKEEKYGRVEREYEEEQPVEGKRGASYEMNKNRGLTPHRNKLVRNPRKKYKVKYEKAVIRRKSQVQGVRPAELTYGGEATGIKANISKSRRLG